MPQSGLAFSCGRAPHSQMAVVATGRYAQGAAWAEKNTMPSSFLDDLLEAYHEVMVQPWGEGLVGKKFPWNWYASCRTHGGEPWCVCVLTYTCAYICAHDSQRCALCRSAARRAAAARACTSFVFKSRSNRYDTATAQDASSPTRWCTR
jgi:hypothetical protein